MWFSKRYTCLPEITQSSRSLIATAIWVLLRVYRLPSFIHMVAKGAQWATLSIARSTFTFHTHHPVFIYCQFLLYFFLLFELFPVACHQFCLQKYYRYLSLSLPFSVYKIQFNCLDCLFPSSYSFFVYLSQSPKATKTRTTKKKERRKLVYHKSVVVLIGGRTNWLIMSSS